jgi:hypothetical protein
LDDSLGLDSASDSLEVFKNTKADDVVILIRGSLILSCLMQAPQILSKPLTSGMLALAWSCAHVCNRAFDDKQSLSDSIEGNPCKQRDEERCL